MSESVERLVALLTPRESDVLRLTLYHWQRKEIALLLGVSPETVKSHLRAAVGKLNRRTIREIASDLVTVKVPIRKGSGE